MMPALAAFALAALAALAGAFGFGWLASSGYLGGILDRAPIVYLVTPLLILGLFQFVFASLTRRWRGWRFWAVAVPFVAVVWFVCLAAMLTDSLTFGQAIALVLALKLGFGLLALRLTDPEARP